MGTKLPITVVIPSYNHARYVEESLVSVFEQTSLPDEILVVDDGSSDKSVDILKNFGKKITLITFEINQGAAAATNFAIQNARNPYIAILNSDDVWETSKLEKQFSWMVNNEYDLTFTTASIIDQLSRPVKNPPSYFDVFFRTEPINDSYLTHFFYYGNFLCHPSLIIKKDAYERFGYYRNDLRQLPDLERWISFAKRLNIGVTNQNLVKFRWTEGLNTSGQSLTPNYIRTQNEHLLLYLNFFEGLKDSEIRDIFSIELEALAPRFHSIAEVDPGSALLLAHPEPSVKYQTTLSGYLRLLQNNHPPVIDKAIQDLSGSFQVNLEFENLINHFETQHFAFKLLERIPLSIRKYIRELGR